VAKKHKSGLEKVEVKVPAVSSSEVIFDDVIDPTAAAVRDQSSKQADLQKHPKFDKFKHGGK
jgi:hypothetical protein